MKKIISLFFVVIILWGQPMGLANAAYDIEVEVSAESLLLVNLDNGQILLDKNSKQKMYPASLTKIMTAIVVLEHYQGQNIDEITIQAKGNLFAEFAGINISNADIRAGEILTVRQLLYCIMLQSANEAANILADHIGDGKENFISKMNETAKRIGANNTNYVNPHGLFHEDQYTTAYDMYLISKHAMSIPGFMDIVSAPRYEIPQTNKHAPRVLSTTILLQDKTRGGQYYRNYIKGIKTGTTDQSGRCVISTATKNGVNYLQVVMKAPVYDAKGVKTQENTSFLDTIRVYEWGFQKLKSQKVAKTNEAIAEINLALAQSKDHLLLYPKEDFYVSIPKTSDETAVKKVFVIPEKIKAPVTQGQVIGVCEFMLFDQKVGQVDLISTESVEVSYPKLALDLVKRGFSSVWAKIILILSSLAFLVYILAVIRDNNHRNKNKVKRKK